jgi:type IV pilus assembly protein PilN
MSRRTIFGKLGATRIEAPDAPLRPAPIRINLLPHREAARERRKRDFLARLIVVGLAGGAAVLAGGMAISHQIDTQRNRNEFIQTENTRLDKEIAEIRTLREEIAALKARQQAVENLQSDRTVPVHLFDELVKLAPEGLYLRQLKQDDRKVTLVGHAQTNERVAELLRNLTDRSPWIERPELTEIKEVALKEAASPAGPNQKEKEARKVFEFSLNAMIRKSAPPADERNKAAPRTDSTAPVKLGQAG